MTSTTRAPPPFQPVNNNPLYPGQGAGAGGQMGGPYDMYPGQTRAGFNSIIPFNQTRQIHTMPGEAQGYCAQEIDQLSLCILTAKFSKLFAVLKQAFPEIFP